MKWLTLITGHLGALGRAGLFLLVSVLMWRALDGSETTNPAEKEKNTIGRAFTQLQVSLSLVERACGPRALQVVPEPKWWVVGMPSVDQH